MMDKEFKTTDSYNILIKWDCFWAVAYNDGGKKIAHLQLNYIENDHV